MKPRKPAYAAMWYELYNPTTIRVTTPAEQIIDVLAVMSRWLARRLMKILRRIA